jgi:HEAT repeat protein
MTGVVVVFLFVASLALALHRNASHPGSLARNLQSKDPDKREKARQALALAGSPAVPALIEVLNTSLEPGARQDAAALMGLAGDRRAVGALVTALGDPSPRVGLEAAASLIRIGDPAAVPALLGHLKASQDDTLAGEIAGMYCLSQKDGLKEAGEAWLKARGREVPGTPREGGITWGNSAGR